MEVSALRYTGTIGLHGRGPLLRLQSDERLVTLVRRGNHGAFEVLVGRYESRLLAFCRHMLRSREDAEDVLQEVFAAAFNALLADDREINVRPWLYRIARNRSLNHLRRTQAVGVDSMDVHLSDFGATTADKVHEREDFRMLVGDIRELPETQRTALLLREMEALSYEQIAEAMETTVPSVKSLLVRARVSLAEAAEARLLSCDVVRIELGEIAEGIQRRPSALVRRHLKSCERCAQFRTQLQATNRALAALLPLSPLIVLKKLAIVHLSHSAGGGATAAGGGATAAGTGALAGTGAGSIVSTAVGAVATKAAAGLAAAAIVTAGAVEVHTMTSPRPQHPHQAALAASAAGTPSASAHVFTAAATVTGAPIALPGHRPGAAVTKKKPASAKDAQAAANGAATPSPGTAAAGTSPAAGTPADAPGRTQTQTDPTVLPLTVTNPFTTTIPTTTPAPEPAAGPTPTTATSTAPPPPSTTTAASTPVPPVTSAPPSPTDGSSTTTTSTTSAPAPPADPPPTTTTSSPTTGDGAPSAGDPAGGTTTTTAASTTPPPATPGG